MWIGFWRGFGYLCHWTSSESPTRSQISHVSMILWPHLARAIFGRHRQPSRIQTQPSQIWKILRIVSKTIELCSNDLRLMERLQVKWLPINQFRIIKMLWKLSMPPENIYLGTAENRLAWEYFIVIASWLDVLFSALRAAIRGKSRRCAQIH